MERRAGFPSFLAFLVACVFVGGCSGTPADLNTVQLTPGTSQTIAGGGSVHIAATVVNDLASAGVTWALSPTTGSGTLSGITTTSVTYDAPAVVTVATTVKVIATSVAHTDESATLSITVAPPQKLAIATTSPLPSGPPGVAYSLQLLATGGTAPYQWSLATGSTLPAGLALSASGLLSGTPTTAATTTFGVTVTDAETPPASATGNFSLTIGTVTGLALLKGPFAFEFSGFNSSGAVVTAGSFTADGAGNITGGVEDFNSIQGPERNQTFTGTYTLGAGNRGTLAFSSLTGAPTYTFAIDTTGAHGRLVEFDASGIRGSGQLEKQTVTTCGADTISSTSVTGEAYVFGITGSAAAFSGVTTAGPVVIAGEFTALPPAGTGVAGSLAGEADINIPGISIPSPINSTSAPVLSGTFQTTTQTGRCSMSLTPQQTSSLNFSVYPVSGNATALTQAFVIETDKVQAASPYLTVGKLMQQCVVVSGACETFPFSAQTPGAFFTAASVAALTGEVLNSNVTPNVYVPDEAIAELTGTGGPTFTMSVVENQAGTTGTYQSPFQANFDYLDVDGRISTNLITPFAPVFYVISQNEALCIGQINNNPFFGYFEPQSTGPFSAATIKGTFIEGTAAPTNSSAQDFSGVVALDGVSAVTGTEDVSTSVANTAAETVTGTYTSVASATGAGSYALTAPSTFTGQFFIVTPTKFVLVSTTPGDLNPILTIFGD